VHHDSNRISGEASQLPGNASRRQGGDCQHQGGVSPLLTPIIIIGGILSGFFTPTEAAVIASLYALFLGFLYKDISLKDCPVFWQSIKQTVSLLFIISAAGFFGWLTIHQKIRIRSFSP